MRGAVVERELPAVVGALPGSLEPAVLAALAERLLLVGEVGIQLEGEDEGGRSLAEVRQVHVLVQTPADVARQAQLQRVRGRLLQVAAALVGRPGRAARRQAGVVAEPGVLGHVRQRHRPRPLALDEPAIAGEHARLVHEEPALGAAYKFTLRGSEAMDDEAFAQAGGNRSLVHVDFMIGSADLDIDGVRVDGSSEALMRSGEWATAI